MLCSVWAFNEIEGLLLFLHLKALDFFFSPNSLEKRDRRRSVSREARGQT